MSSRPIGCPSWCTVLHDELEGEDARVHSGDPVAVTHEVTARLVADEALTAPYVLLGDEERTLGDATVLGAALIGLAEAGRRRAAPRTPPLGPSPAAS